MKKIVLFIATLFCSTFIWAGESVNDTIMATNNGYLNEGAKASTLIHTVWNMEVRTATNYTRWGYVQIPLEKIVSDADKVEFKIYLTGEKLAVKNTDGTFNPTSYTSEDLDGKDLQLSLYSLNYTFDSEVTWNTRTIPDASNEVLVGDLTVTNNQKDTYLTWDVTALAKAKKAAGDSHLYVRLETKGADLMLRLRQIKIKTGDTGSYYPRLIQTKAGSSISETKADGLLIYPTVATTEITIGEGNSVKVFDMQGKLVLDETIENKIVNVSGLNAGMYILRNETGATAKFIKR